MRILLLCGGKDTTENLRESLKKKVSNINIDVCVSSENLIKSIEKADYEILLLNRGVSSSVWPEFIARIRNLGWSLPVMILANVEMGEGEKVDFLSTLFEKPDIFGDSRIDKNFESVNAELISKKGSIKSAFAEVWKMRDYVVKIKDGGLREAERQMKYQIELREKLSFLPKYYGIVLNESNGNKILANFYEYVSPLTPDDFSVKEIREILEIIEEAYKNEYYGIDLKPSNFGKKDNRIYYLDEEGIGGYVPSDWTELLRDFLKKVHPANNL